MAGWPLEACASDGVTGRGDLPSAGRLGNLQGVEGEDQGASGPLSRRRLGGDDGDGLRGWIPPDDRLWRHPSESSAPGAGPADGRPVATTAQRRRSGTWVIGGATACVLVALVAVGLMIATTGGSDDDAAGPVRVTPTITSEPDHRGRSLGARRRGPASKTMVAPVEASTVALRVTGPDGVSTSAGLVAESGGIIVTTAGRLAGARSITAIEADGTRQAGHAGRHRSGIGAGRGADLRRPARPPTSRTPTPPSGGRSWPWPSTRPAAPASRARGPHLRRHGHLHRPGRRTAGPMPAAWPPSTSTAPLSAGGRRLPADRQRRPGHRVARVGRAIGHVAPVGLPPRPAGARGGRATGRLGRGGPRLAGRPGQQRPPTHVPDHHRQPADRRRRRLGGARLDAVEPDSPAASAGMAPGDVITAVDGGQVQSTAELATRLYAEPPGTPVEITYQRGTSGPRPPG